MLQNFRAFQMALQFQKEAKKLRLTGELRDQLAAGTFKLLQALK
jgi:hypothetical protein